MCGIAGFTIPPALPPERRRERHGEALRRMTASLRHRGPDAQRALLLDGVALGHTRLAILDLTGGVQPMRDAATGVTLVYNGEIFNHVELREGLAGYPFRTRSDTEVVLASYLRWGLACLERFNGQFAFALWDPRSRALHLARDRFGILPLYYAATGEGVAFASEAKALFASGLVTPALDPRGVKQAIQLWSPVPPRTCFANVNVLPPGCVATVEGTRVDVRRWWELDLGDERLAPIEERDAVERLGALLDDAVRLRLRADVPVGAYLSGGLDSSLVSALAQRRLGGTLSTFSVAFTDEHFDESAFQREVAQALATKHRAVTATAEIVGELLPEVVYHAEQVLIRSAPAPLLWLSREVRRSGGKVVLTGEGSDEVLLGYDLYRETRVRGFWARRPASRLRPALLRRLYPYLPLSAQGDAMLRYVYGVGLDDPGAPAFSHLVRWAASARVTRLFAADFAASIADEDPVASVVATLPDEARRWRPLARAQYLEMKTLLAGNLLAPQGDRMLMAGSVEGRFPYLDHRLVDFASTLQDRLKLRGLVGKWVLREAARGLVPDAILRRPKFPYRAPVAAVLAGVSGALLSPDAIRRVGVFDGAKVASLRARILAGGPVSEVDAMGMTAVASTQLLERVLGCAPPERDVAAVTLEAA